MLRRLATTQDFAAGDRRRVHDRQAVPQPEQGRQEAVAVQPGTMCVRLRLRAGAPVGPAWGFAPTGSFAGWHRCGRRLTLAATYAGLADARSDLGWRGPDELETVTGTSCMSPSERKRGCRQLLCWAQATCQLAARGSGPKAIRQHRLPPVVQHR
jgi:hypothetical protein